VRTAGDRALQNVRDAVELLHEMGGYPELVGDPFDLWLAVLDHLENAEHHLVVRPFARAHEPA
jgi:hypothetical protein